MATRLLAAILVSGGLAAGTACATVRPAATPSPFAASTDSARAPAGERFYASRPYGSESEFNPLTTVINEGFDQLSRGDANRHIFSLDYKAAATNVLHSMLDPERAWSRFGWGLWLRDEVFPLTGKAGGGGQWVPNYVEHLLGEGMTGVRLEEWYTQHGVAHPELLAGLTDVTYSFLNEMIEHQHGDGANEDAATDLDVFDTGALVLWHFDAVRNIFAGPVRLTNWFPQPTLTLPGPTLENATELYMLRVRLPGADNWRPMTTFGGSLLFGLSHRQYADRWLTLAAGWDPAENPVIDSATGLQTVELQPNFGAFFDRDGSLLADVLVRSRRTERVLVNVYPGVVKVGSYSPGLMFEYLKTHQVRVGIVGGWGLGLGMAPH